MARLARIVVPKAAHLVTQRGNRRQPTFLIEDDYKAYLALVSEWCQYYRVQIWAYCLMSDHVHLILVPRSEDGLRRALSEAHQRYTRRINFREDWRGHLWQGRFASFAMDQRHLPQAARYVEMSPVRAKLCRAPWRWPWSSASAHVAGRDDDVVRVAPVLKCVEDWRRYLAETVPPEETELYRSHERTGRPLGTPAFLDRLERTLGRSVRPGKPGRKPKRHKK